MSPSSITKYCACHEKSLSSLILVTYETSDGVLPLHPLLPLYPSYTLNEVFHIVAIRASKKAVLGASKFTALRAMHFPMYGMVCRYGTARHGCMYVGCNLQQTLDKTNLQAACKAGKTLPNATGPGASGDQSAGLVPSDQLPEIRFSAILRPQVERF